MSYARVAPYWEAFLASLPEESLYQTGDHTVESFGDSPELADELGELILRGTKTATCSALWEWQADHEPLAEPGRLTILLDGKHVPICIIETTEVVTCPYDQVDAAFAADEGEGDRTLESWRAVHRDYFERTLPYIGKAFAPDMPLVCERFRVIYP